MKYLFVVIIIAILVFVSCKELTQQPGNFDNLSVDEMQRLLKDNPDVVLLDVRTPKEIAAGKIDNALEIDVQQSDFGNKLDALDKDKTYLVYCRSGRRSVTACNIMSKSGFEKLYNLKGGYNEWKATQQVK